MGCQSQRWLGSSGAVSTRPSRCSRVPARSSALRIGDSAMTDNLRVLLGVLDGPTRPDDDFADALFAEVREAIGTEELSIAFPMPQPDDAQLRSRLVALDADPRVEGIDAR